MRTSSLAPTQSLFRWIWRAFFRTALTPLLLVEVVLVLAYIASNNLVRDENLAAIRTVAGNEVVDIATRQSILIDQDVRNVHSAMSVLADGVTRSFTEPLHLRACPSAFRWVFDPDPTRDFPSLDPDQLALDQNGFVRFAVNPMKDTGFAGRHALRHHGTQIRNVDP